jgi:hypothetical protein
VKAKRSPLAGSGYCPCRCRDCFEVAIKSAHERDAFCHACVTAGCEEGDHECAAREAAIDELGGEG